MQIIWQDNAIENLDNIYEFVAKQSVLRALDLIDSIKAEVEKLAFWSEKFQKETFIENSRNIRYTVIYSYKIIYEVTPNAIFILSIFHTAQSPDKLKNI